MEQLPRIGDVHVRYKSSPPANDKLGKFCSGRKLYVRFERNPGDLPLVEINSENVTGSGLEVTVKEVRIVHIAFFYYFSFSLSSSF